MKLDNLLTSSYNLSEDEHLDNSKIVTTITLPSSRQAKWALKKKNTTKFDKERPTMKNASQAAHTWITTYDSQKTHLILTNRRNKKCLHNARTKVVGKKYADVK